MVTVVFKVALLVHLLHLIVQVAGQSPCPNYFRYLQDETTSEVTGYIEIASPPKGVALHISVGLSIAVALPTKYVGRLELAESREQSVKSVQQGRPLKYKIHFPLRRPIPVLTDLWFNNQLICTGPRANGPIFTSIVLNHTLYPYGMLSTNDGDFEDNLPSKPVSSKTPTFEPYAPPNFVSNRVPNATPKPYFDPFVPSNGVSNRAPSVVPNSYMDDGQNNLECGRSKSMDKVNTLVVGGEKTVRGQWPWLVALFINEINIEFQCAGTLVTNKHVITAAHCLIKDNVNLPVGVLLVSVGRYRLQKWFEEGSANREVAEFKLHHDYNVTGGNADSDLAVLILRERVEYSEVIKPICLWSGPTNLANVVGKIGLVVGWGRDELGNRYVQEPREVRAPIVSQEDCLRSHEYFIRFTSKRTFCAGFNNGSGPCNGDSGSGFVMYDNDTDRYYLRGVVSRSLIDSRTQSCDVTKYIIYVDVAKYLNWIKRQIST